VEVTGEYRVVLCDDHDMFRTALRHLVEENGPVRVVGEAATGEGALALVREQAPDVVVMDIEMPGLGGVEATRKIVEESPHTSVVVLTASDDADDVVSAIVAGACGYLLKNAAIDDLVAGIRAAAIGDALISPAIAGGLLAHVRERARPAEPPAAAATQLSARELDVLRLVAEGRDNADIARELFISPKTVKNHISNILMKLQMQNRIQAAVYAVRKGIV
jgi:DNA-binding NarL/FixJ family response regulator